MANVLTKILNLLDLGGDSVAAYVEGTDGDGIQPDKELEEVAKDIKRSAKDFGKDLPDWVTVELLVGGLKEFLRYIAANKPA